MKAYIQHIDITSDGQVIVSGQLSRTNLTVSLNEHIYITEPSDGIWGYTLEVLPTSSIGADIMVPFSVTARWTGNEQANGIRISQPTLSISDPDHETIQLKVKKVDRFTIDQANFTILRGASFEKGINQLVVDIEYSGGCFPHQFALEWDGASLESFPPQYVLNIVDLSEYDPCKAIVPVQLRFDIDTPNIRFDRPSVIKLGTPKNNRQIRIELN